MIYEKMKENEVVQNVIRLNQPQRAHTQSMPLTRQYSNKQLYCIFQPVVAGISRMVYQMFSQVRKCNGDVGINEKGGWIKREKQAVRWTGLGASLGGG